MVDGACYLADEVIIVVGEDRGVDRKGYIEHKAVVVDTLGSHQSVPSHAGETLVN